MFVTVCYSGYSHHIGDGVGQLSDLTNNGNGPNSNGTSGPPSGSTGGSGSGDENGYVPQGYDNDQDYHSISETGTHPGYVENSPEFYSSTLLDKSFQPSAFLSNNKNFSRSKCILGLSLSLQISTAGVNLKQNLAATMHGALSS